MIDDKSKRVITAAADVFLRYGYARTTMGDIAKATGISRPALYILFPGKEQIFEASTMFLAKQRLEEIRSAVASCPGLEAKLTTAFEMLLVRVFELQQSTPDARDMDDLGFPVVRNIYAMFVDFFAEVIDASVTNPPAPSDQIARGLLFGLRGLREVAQSADDFSQMIRLHIRLIWAGGLGRSD